MGIGKMLFGTIDDVVFAPARSVADAAYSVSHGIAFAWPGYLNDLSSRFAYVIRRTNGTYDVIASKRGMSYYKMKPILMDEDKWETIVSGVDQATAWTYASTTWGII